MWRQHFAAVPQGQDEPSIMPSQQFRPRTPSPPSAEHRTTLTFANETEYDTPMADTPTHGSTVRLLRTVDESQPILYVPTTTLYTNRLCSGAGLVIQIGCTRLTDEPTGKAPVHYDDPINLQSYTSPMKLKILLTCYASPRC